MDELQANGGADRSQLIVLLSDGRSDVGSEPRQVAEAAGEQGIEISTIGLGDTIDEAELRDIADATGGDFHHVQDAEDLPETFERVAQNRTDRRLRDTSGDGIPDAVAEANPRMPTLASLFGTRVHIDPHLADTSGDGLLDNESVDVAYRIVEEGNETVLETRVTSAVANPGRLDTDGDLLTDYEEVRILGTNARLSDTSGDGLNDYVDPEPLRDTVPPRVTVRSDEWNEYVSVFGDSDLETVEASAYYDPVAPWDDPYWSEDMANVHFADERGEESPAWLEESLEVAPAHTAVVTFEEHGVVPGGAPVEIKLTLIDERGNSATYRVDVSGDTPEFVDVGLSFGIPAVFAPEGTSTLAGGAVVGLMVGALVIDGIGESVFDGSEVTEETLGPTGTDVLHGEVEQTWELSDGTDVALPAGAHYADGRGYGWEQIRSETDLTQAELGRVVTNPHQVVRGPGEVDWYIGRGRTAAEEKAIIALIGGTIVAASTAEPVEGPCGHEVHFVPDEGHGLREGKPFDTLNEVRKAVESATQVWRSSNPNTPKWLYYVTRTGDGGWTIIKVGPQGVHPIAEWVFSTVLSSERPDDVFDSLEEATDEMDDRADQPERIDDDPSEC